MASKESLGRVRHFDLSSKQLRLRHLRSISVRKIIPKFSIFGDNLLDRLLETYFTLHSVEGNQKAIYTSEKIKYSLNPTWASFEPSSWKNQKSTTVSSVIVRVWGGQKNKFRLIIEWKVDLPSLQYLGDQVRSSKYGQNTVIFGLIDGYYSAPSCLPKDETPGSGETGVVQGKDVIKVDADQVQISCKLLSVQRLQAIQKAILQSQLSVRDVRQAIQYKVESDIKSTSQLSEQEMLKLKIKLLREEWLSKQKLLLKEREEEKSISEKLKEREINLKRDREKLDFNKVCLREHKQAYVEKRETFVKVTAQMNMRRRQLISELITIYPIVELQGSKEFVISGVRLPNCESDEFQAMDDETLSVALGYTCHLVCMIAQFLDLPLRYSMQSRGSRSTIMDFAIEKVAEKERQFPLYNKGKEKIKFYYGTFLLNKNIAQLRQFNGLGTPNLRNTLPNLKDLLETKFQTSVKSAPLTIIRKSPLKQSKKRASTSGSGGSGESSSSNPKLDDVLLRTMSASTSEAKSAIPEALSAAQVNLVPNTETTVTGEEDSKPPVQHDLVDSPVKPVLDDHGKIATSSSTDSSQLHIPAQGTSHLKFLEQQRSKKATKLDNTKNAKTKPPRTLSLKGQRPSTVEKRKLVRNNTIDTGTVTKEVASKLAESTVNDVISSEGKRDISGRQHLESFRQVGSSSSNGETSTVRGDIASEKANVSKEPSQSDKPLFRNDELRAKRNFLFDVEGSINFDSYCENGDLDLR